MQARRLFASLVFWAVLVAVPAAPWSASFDAQDLEGEWYGVALDVVDTENDPYLLEYAFTTDAEGEVSGTVTAYFEVAPAEVFPILSGHLDITAAGAVGPADLNVAPSEYFHVPELQMNEDRDFMAGSGAAVAAGRQINLFAKVGDSYGVADLEGYWKIAGYAEQIGSDHLAEKIAGVLQLNGAGEVVDASWIAFGAGPVEEIPAGTAVPIDASGSFVPELGVEPSMQLAAGKTLAVGRAVGWESSGRSKQQVYTLVKTASGAVATDMARNWYVKTFSDESVANIPSVESGNIQVDVTGTSISGGLLRDSEGVEQTVTEGTVATDDQGVVTLTGIRYSGSSVVTTGSVALDAGREVFAGHTTDSDGRVGLIVGVPEPDTAWLALASLVVLAAFRRWSSAEVAALRG